MSRRSDQLGKLAGIARIRADIELRRFAAVRKQAAAMQGQIDAVRSDLAEAIAAPATDALEHWQQTAALVGYRAEAVLRAEIALKRMKPALDSAHAAAAAAFGRAEALVQLRDLTLGRERQDRDRRGP